MNAKGLLVAIIAFIGIVTVMPIWEAADTGSLPLEQEFLAGLVISGALLLFIASWILPGLSVPVIRTLVIIGLVAIVPTLFNFTQVASNEMDGLPGVLAELALPVLFVVAILTIATDRVIPE